MNSHNERTILIAAPGSGIGKEITKKLLEDGYRIIGIGGKSSREYFDQLKEQYGSIDFHRTK